jgi:hypothetical protein
VYETKIRHDHVEYTLGRFETVKAAKTKYS